MFSIILNFMKYYTHSISFQYLKLFSLISMHRINLFIYYFWCFLLSFPFVSMFENPFYLCLRMPLVSLSENLPWFLCLRIPLFSLFENPFWFLCLRIPLGFSVWESLLVSLFENPPWFLCLRIPLGFSVWESPWFLCFRIPLGFSVWESPWFLCMLETPLVSLLENPLSFYA